MSTSIPYEKPNKSHIEAVLFPPSSEHGKESRSEYRILMHPGSRDCYLMDDEFETVDEAVKYAIQMGTGDFNVITVIDWKASA